MTIKDAAQLAAHITDLAAAFKIRLCVRDHMAVEDAGAGFVVLVCPQCTSHNALRRPGVARCGRCKHPLGAHECFLSIVIAPVTDETSYAIALHELGHGLHPTGRVSDTHGSRTMRTRQQIGTLADVRHQLLEEESAWEWAERHALDWTPTMEHVKRIAIGTYYANARRLGLRPDGRKL